MTVAARLLPHINSLAPVEAGAEVEFVQPVEAPSAMRTARKTPKARARRKRRTTPHKTAPTQKASHWAPQHVHVTTFLAALMLAVVSGGYSIFGLASIFTGAMLPVIGMGLALEIGKLSAVAWLGEGRGSRTLRVALVALVGVLMCLNAIGAYGFLARAHIAAGLNSELATMGKSAEVAARIEATHEQIADLDRRVAQIDEAVSTATRKGRTSSAMDLAASQRRNRETLNTQRAEAGRALIALQVEAASIDGQRRVAQADLGPVIYLATPLGVPPDAMMRWFVLLVAVLLDPAAVLLLMAATARARQ
jgi:hypothetical protein